MSIIGPSSHVVVVFFTLFIDRASTIPSNIRGCQSGTWSQRGTKVNGSHHGDNPLPRPTGIQIATKSYSTLQAMTPTNNKTVNQTSFTPYREQREQPRSTRIVVAYPRPAFSATNRTNTFQPVLINKEFQVNNGVLYCFWIMKILVIMVLCCARFNYCVLDLSLLFDDVLFCLPFCWCPCMAINVSVQYDGGFLPDIILLTQCYYHRGTRLNAMKRFCIFSY